MNRAKSDVSAAELKGHTTSSTISPKYSDGLPFDVASTSRGLRGAGDSLLLCSISFFRPGSHQRLQQEDGSGTRGTSDIQLKSTMKPMHLTA
jgi:hypothetical protein